MKGFVTWFLFYLLFLSVIPCDERDNCCREEQMTHAQSGSSSQNNKPEIPCSPFFACGANHGIVLPENRIEMNRLVLQTHKVRNAYTEKPVTASLSSIWQPPRRA